MKLIPIPIPVNGLNTIDPTVTLETGYARELTNLFVNNGKVKVRPAARVLHYFSLQSKSAAWFDTSSGTPYLIEYFGGSIRDVSSGSITGSVGGSVQAAGTMFKHHTIDVLCGCKEPRSPAGPNFTSHGFTLNQITDETTIISGCSHRGRPYFTDGEYVEYGDVGQVTGAFASDGLAGGYFDPSPYLDGQIVLRIFSVTIQQGNESDNVLVLFGDGGKVLVYSGDWPDADNFALVGSYNMAKPASLTSFLEIDGDIIVSSQEYCYWFRDLLTSGPIAAYENRPSKAIQNLWQSLEWETPFLQKETPHIFYLKNLVDADGVGLTNLDVIVFQTLSGAGQFEVLVDIADYQNQAVYLVYMRQTRAWALWMMTPMFSPVRQGDDPNTYYALGASGEIKTFFIDKFADNYLDTASNSLLEVEIEGNWKTPYVNTFKGISIAVKGVRFFFTNTVSKFFNVIRAIYDFSDYTANFGFATQDTSSNPLNPANSNTASLDASANTSGIYSGLVNPGGLGAGVSIQFNFQRKSGSDIDQKQEILGATLLADEGGVLY